MDNKTHWDDIYNRKKFSEVTWFQPEPKVSMQLISNLNLSLNANILDAGGGASTLVDKLLDQGFQDISVIDLSENALNQSKNRLGATASNISWIVGDITNYDFQVKFDLWHDRAVFHFLISKDDQENYIVNLNKCLDVGSFFIISTFAEDGPLKCSGLEIVRYSKEELVNKFAGNFELIDFQKETHVSPGGMEQKFNYWVFRKCK